MPKIIASLSLAFSVALCLTAAAAPAPAQELTKQAKIERILDLMNYEASVNQVLNQITSMVNAQMKSTMPNAGPDELARVRDMQSKMMELVKSRMSWTKMRPEYARIYGEVYTDEEINAMLAFYESPAGRGVLQKMPLVTERSMAVSQALMGDLMPEIQRIQRESMPKKQ